MANILEFLRGVLTDPNAQQAFYGDAPGFVQRAGFGDLTGEDVVEAIRVLRRSLPADLAGALAPFDDDDALPAVRPTAEETELDAAIRQLAFAIRQAPLAGVEIGDLAEPEPEPEPEPAGPLWPDTVAQANTGEEDEEEPAAEEVEQEAGDEEGIDLEVELDTDASIAATAAPPRTEIGELASVVAFAEALDAITADARARLLAVLQEAQRDGDLLRNEGEDAREAGRRAKAQAGEEADSILENARQHGDEARRRAEELIGNAEEEAASIRAEIEARRTEIRDAERQLKERLAGIDSVFRTVLRDDEQAGSDE